MLNSNNQFSLNVPFTFPDFVNPPWKHMIKREKIQLNVNAGTGNQLLCKAISHPLKVHIWLKFCMTTLNVFHVIIWWFFSLIAQEVSHHAGSVGLLYESDVLSWTKYDFTFTYAVRLMVMLCAFYSLAIERCPYKHIIFIGSSKWYKWQPSTAICIWAWFWSKRDVLLIHFSWKIGEQEGWYGIFKYVCMYVCIDSIFSSHFWSHFISRYSERI